MYSSGGISTKFSLKRSELWEDVLGENPQRFSLSFLHDVSIRDARCPQVPTPRVCILRGGRLL